MREQIAIILAKNIGQVLTMDLATEIAVAICECADATVDVSKFKQETYKGYQFQCELLRDILPDMHKLHVQHYAEVEVEKAGLTFNPDYDRLLDIEKRGGLLQFTARKNGELIGNMRIYVSKSTHTQTMICSEDTFYIVPEHRGGFTAVRFWQYVERCCIDHGAREIQFDSKLINNADSMARYLKYQPVAIKFMKVIDHVQT